MTISTAFDFPPGGAHGELRVAATADVLQQPGASTFYFARRFDFEAGDHTFETTVDDTLALWLGTNQMNSRIFANTVIGAPGTVTINIPEAGTYRLDAILRNVPDGPNPAYFILVIKREGQVVYASNKDFWRWDYTIINDDDLPEIDDYRLKLPVWSILPNWEDGMTERLTWQTDIMDSETDAEQRRSVRRNARRSFEVSFLRQRGARNRLDTFFVGVGSAPFMMPLFHEQVKMIDGIDFEGNGVVFPDGDFSLREFRTGDLVFVTNGDPDVYDIYQVGITEPNRFSWAFPPTRRWDNGTRIYPMRVARIYSQAPKMSNVTDTVSRAQVIFDLMEPYKIEPSFGTVVNSEPFFRFAVDRASPIDVSYTRRNFVIDNQAGVPQVTDHGEYTATTIQTRMRLFGREDAFAFRQFLQAARGRSKHFYAPTFMQDVQPQGDIESGTVNLVIRDQGFHSYMDRPQAIRLRLSFQYRANVAPLYRDVIGAYPIYKLNAGGSVQTPLTVIGEALILSAALPAITLDELRRISFICETRFDQDSFEIHHPTNGQAMIEVALVLRQSMNQRTGNPV